MRKLESFPIHVHSFLLHVWYNHSKIVTMQELFIEMLNQKILFLIKEVTYILQILELLDNGNLKMVKKIVELPDIWHPK